jgi:hypothetical protein
MHELNGGCHCGNIVVTAKLGGVPGSYIPRACDCSFCRKHGAAYISDAQGSLLIRASRQSVLTEYRQGSRKAQFRLCATCGVLIGGFFESAGRLYGAVNVAVFDGTPRFGATTAASPQRLAPGDKVARWKELWFADVRIETGGAPSPGQA